MTTPKEIAEYLRGVAQHVYREREDFINDMFHDGIAEAIAESMEWHANRIEQDDWQAEDNWKKRHE